MKRRYSAAIILMGLIFISFAFTPRPTLASNYSVASANDLIAAINAANSDASLDTILLTADVTLNVAAETTAAYGTSGLPAITTEVVIDGQGHMIKRDAQAPDFRILRVAATGTVSVYNLTISGGIGTVGTCYSGNICGSGILSAGVLTLTHVNVSGNTEAVGNGLFEESGSVNVYDSTFSNNSSIGLGGAIFVHTGSLNIDDSVITNNSADAGGGGVGVDQGSVTVNHTTFSGNTTANRGGGLASNSRGTVISNSTFVNNSAHQGGGVALLGDGRISNSTFSGNSALNTSDNPLNNGFGGGAWFQISFGTVSLEHVTFVGNRADIAGGVLYFPGSLMSINDSIIVQSTQGGNCIMGADPLQSGSENLADDATCPGFTDLSNPPKNLNLGPLADNGGSTKTYAINSPSPAFNGATGTCTFDQRGIARGADVPQNNHCDIGAYEVTANGSIRTLEFATSASGVNRSTANTAQVPLKLDSSLYQADTVKAYVWVSGGTAVAGVDYVPFGVQTVSIMPGNESGLANITLLNPSASTDKTIVLSFAAQNGPGFQGAARLGTQLTHTVTLYTSDANTGNGQNYTVGNATELVNAITMANASNGTDTILLANDITLTTKADTSADFGDSGLPAITSHIRIDGQGHSISRSASNGIPNFRIIRVAPAGILTLDNVTLSGGKTSANGFIAGGGLFSEGTVSFNNSTISGNNADFGAGLGLQYGTVNINHSTISNNSTSTFGSSLGGGIIALAGNLNVMDSAVSHNTSTGSGGGIYGEQSFIVVDHDTISDNTAVNTGGGMIFGDSNGSVTISNSTFSGNSANSGGGAALAGQVDVSNTTFSGNSATQYGGGAELSGYQKPMTVNHVTFTGNTAASGGGIYVADSDGLVTISNTVITQSSAGGDCFFWNGVAPAGSSNFADDASCSGFTLIVPPTPIVSGSNATPARNYFTTRTPTLTWNQISQAVRYEIQVATTNTFTNAPIYDAGNTLSFTWPMLLANDTYVWHVRACSGAAESSCGAWSAPDTFTISVP